MQPDKEVSLFLVLAGPAGSGKTTLCERLVAEEDGIERVVTCTTRAPREGEVDGVDYHFLSDEQFDRSLETGAFLEWAKVHANRYGTLRSVVQAKLAQRTDLVINVDVQGVSSLRAAAGRDEEIASRIVTIFLYPESLEVVRERLRGRGKDDDEEIERRVQTAAREIELWPDFDYTLVSRSKQEDYAALKSILKAEKLRSLRRC